MNVFKDININLDEEVAKKKKEKIEKKKRVKATLELVTKYFPDIIEALSDKGYQAKFIEKEKLNGKVIEIEGQDYLGLFYYEDPLRKGVAVELNNGKTKVRHDYLYATGDKANCLKINDIDVSLEKLMEDHYEALIRKLENQY